MDSSFLTAAIRQFQYYKMLAEKSIGRLGDDQLFWRYNERSNSIAIIIQHISGNMLSRFTDFLTTDGEKPWRDRDKEFAAEIESRQELIANWESGWSCLFDALRGLEGLDLEKVVYIRNQGHTVTEAILRQLSHCAYHAGQIVFIAKMLTNNWESLSIPLMGSGAYNADKFAVDKMRKHFTDEILNRDPETEV